jgi:hypothetical protein
VDSTKTENKGDATTENIAITSSFKKPVLIFTVNKAGNTSMYKYRSTQNEKRI